MIQKIIILFAFIGLICLRAETECQDFYNYDSSERERIMKKVKTTALAKYAIEVDHPYFKDDTPDEIIKKMDAFTKCFKSEKDPLNQYLSKAYIARLYYRMGNFEDAEGEIVKIKDWLFSETELAIEEKFKSISQFIEDLEKKFLGPQSEFATMTIRIAPTAKGPRIVPEGALVNQEKKGELVSMSILLPEDGEYIFGGDLTKKDRFLFLKENRTQIIFSHKNRNGSYEMKIKYLPLLPQDKKYTFLIKDKSNGILQRYTAAFSLGNIDELEIAFSNEWQIKLKAPEGMIKIWLPENLEYTVKLIDNKGDEEIATTHVKDPNTGRSYYIYRLASKENKDDGFDYRLIYVNNEYNPIEKPSVKKRLFKYGFILFSGIIISIALDT